MCLVRKEERETGLPSHQGEKRALRCSSIMGDVGVINHTIYVSNLNEKIKKPHLKKSLYRCGMDR